MKKGSTTKTLPVMAGAVCSSKQEKKQVSAAAEHPAPTDRIQKGDAGKVLVIGGSKHVHGAPIFAGFGALAAGIDLLRIVVPKPHVEVTKYKLLNAFVEHFFGEGCTKKDIEYFFPSAHDWADVVLLGCGFTGAELEATMEIISQCEKPLVLDAGALQPEILPLLKEKDHVLCTPHGGEFQRLFHSPFEKGVGGIFDPGDKKVQLLTMAKIYGITILRTGKEDLISDGKTFIKNETGCPEMTVGGTGDALAGLCAGYMAQGMSPIQAAEKAARDWGLAGEKWRKQHRVFGVEELIEEVNIL